MQQLALLERNVALAGDLDTWGNGFGGACDQAKAAGCARILVQIEENLVPRPGTSPDLTRIAQALWTIRTRNLYAGTWHKVPAADESTLAYAKRQSDYIGALQKIKIDAAGDVSKLGKAQGPSEHMLDLEANWTADEMVIAVTLLRDGDVNLGIVGRTLLMTSTHEPTQDETKVRRNALSAAGIRAFYSQLYGAKPSLDRRDPVYELAVVMGAAAREPGKTIGHHQVKMMIANGFANAQVKAAGRDVGTYADRLQLTGCKGVAYYLLDDWANTTKYNADVDAYLPLTGPGFAGVNNMDRRDIVIGHAR